MKDWYKLTKQEISKNGGVGLLHYYKSDLLALMNTLFPEFPWKLWKFEGSVTPGINLCNVYNPQLGYWSLPKNARDFIEETAKELNFQTLEDYYGFNGTFSHFYVTFS